MQLEMFSSPRDPVTEDCISVLTFSAAKLNQFVRPLLNEVEYALDFSPNKVPLKLKDFVDCVRLMAPEVSHAYQNGSKVVRYGYQVQAFTEAFRQLLTAAALLARHRSDTIYPSPSSVEMESMVSVWNRWLWAHLNPGDNTI